MSYSYDVAADALYVKLSDEPVQSPQQAMDDGTIIDVDAQGRIRGVDVMSARSGFDIAAIVKRYNLDNSDLMSLVVAWECASKCRWPIVAIGSGN